MRNRDGYARSGPRRALETGPVLGVPALRPAFLDDLSGPAEPCRAPAADPGDTRNVTGADGAKLAQFLDFVWRNPYTGPDFKLSVVGRLYRRRQSRGWIEGRRRLVQNWRAASSGPRSRTQLVEARRISLRVRSSEDWGYADGDDRSPSDRQRLWLHPR